MQTQISKEQFNELYKHWTPKLRAYANKFLHNQQMVEDCVQEVFSKLFIQDFDKIKDHIQAWMFTVCRNTSFKMKKKESIFVYTELDEDEAVCEDPTPDVCLDKKILYKKVENILKKLTPQQRKMIRLKYKSDLSYEEIAKKMKTSTGNVGFHLSTSLKNVRKKLLKSI
jgi:RNA polymerase sigma factor (sigma-70 family)